MSSAGAAMGVEGAAVDPESSPTLTMRDTLKGVILGTAGYMAPEQARGHDADKRADIWAFGAVVYEMLTGEQLFGGATVSDSLAAVLTREPALERVPPAFRKLVGVCLVRDARQRLRDIGDARLALADGAAQASEQPPAQPAPPAARRVAWTLGILAVAFALCALALGVLWLRRPAEEAHAIKFALLPPAKSSFTEAVFGIPAVSPDGQRIAFAAMADRKDLIWVRDLDSMTARPLAGTEGIAGAPPFWSPDSRFLAFFADGKLKKIDTSGGPAITLCAAPNPRGGSWGRRDTIVFNAGGIMRVPAAGGDPGPVTELDSTLGETSHRWPWLLPDGRHFLFLARNAEPEKTAIWVGDLESNARRRVVAASSNAAYDPRGFILFVRQNTLLAQRFDAGRLETAGDPFPVAEQVDYASSLRQVPFSLSETGVLAYYSGATGNDRLTWLDRAGKALGTVGPAGTMLQPAISPDGGVVAIERGGQGGYDIWRHDLAHANDSEVTFGALAAYSVWSPDGSRILFASGRNTGKWGLYVKPAASDGKEELLFESPPVKQVTDWSRDGKFVIYEEIESKTGFDIWVLPNPLGDAAARKPYAFLATEAGEHLGKLSPDGKYLAYQSDESHTYQIYVQSFPAKEGKFQISTNGGTRPVWSRDGKELFYIANDGKMMAVDVKTGARFEYGNPKSLFETRSLLPNRSFDISPDGKRFLMIQPADESAVTSLMVNLNWRAGLKK